MPFKPIKKTCTSGSAHENKPCGGQLTEIPYTKRDGTKLVRTGKTEDYTLEWIGSSAKQETSSEHTIICKLCDQLPHWPRSK